MEESLGTERKTLIPSWERSDAENGPADHTTYAMQCFLLRKECLERNRIYST